jgi:tetratricopeptide (TPR) repeat protein
LPGEGLDRLLTRCLAKDMGERYPSPSELMDAIAELFEEWSWEPPRGVPDAASFTAADYVNRGATYAALDRHAEALADYDAAIRIDPNLAQAHSNRGITYMALGRDTEALSDYDASIALDPKYAIAYVNKGVLHTERDEWDNALRAFETVARLGNNTAAQYAEQVRQISGLHPASCHALRQP